MYINHVIHRLKASANIRHITVLLDAGIVPTIPELPDRSTNHYASRVQTALFLKVNRKGYNFLFWPCTKHTKIVVNAGLACLH